MKKKMLIILLVSLVLISACTRYVVIKDDKEIKLPDNCKLVNNEVICEEKGIIVPDNCYIINNEVKCTPENQEIPEQNGVLYGEVVISDCNPTSMRAFCNYFDKPEDYTLRKILVSERGKDKAPVELSLDENGYFIANLKPGTYDVDINYYSNKEKMDKSLDVPKTIVITEDKVVKFNIYIYHG